MYVATSSQMRKYDNKLLAEGYTIEALVDKASDCLLSHCQSYNKIAIVCGNGNNGADGISLGIKLFNQGKRVWLYYVGDFNHASVANKHYFFLAKQNNLPILFVEEENILSIEKDLFSVDAIVDAMFGFGLHSNPQGVVAMMIQSINTIPNVDIIAIDIPTGLHCDSGIPYQNVICALKTISLTAFKQGFFHPVAKKYIGEVLVEELATKDCRKQLGFARVVDESYSKDLLKQRSYYDYKNKLGKILHITGSSNYKGAALLSAKASVYSGSGIVTVCSSSEVLHNISMYVPEATSMVKEGVLCYSTINEYHALLIGCGLGISDLSFCYVKGVLTNCNIPIVIDGDALTMAAKHKELLKSYSNSIILTPHMGEFKRFVANFNENDVVDIAKEFALKYKVILILKGPNTLITDGKAVYRNTTGNPAMACAGMGDVLAGMVVSFLGQGYKPIDASILATFIHGRCGDVIAKDNYTAIPSKVIEEIPRQMHVLLQKKTSN